jgi:hypothetical protein
MRSSSQVGPKKGKSGPGAARASRSVPLGSTLGSQTSGTSGHSSPGSSVSTALQSFLASRLRQRLEGFGSMEYALTWKAWDMQSGPPICALRASTPRTSGKDFSGWPTPNTRDRGSDAPNRVGSPSLAVVVRMAGWVTPSTRDGKYCSHPSTWKCKEKRERMDQLPRQAYLGIVTKHCPVLTKGTGVLNPEHSRWLMGFPAAWGSCGATAMQSCRSSRQSS